MGNEAAKKLVDLMFCMPDSWHDDPPYCKTKLGPGQAIAKLPQETQEILKTLKSDDIRNVYFGPNAGVIGPDYPPNWHTKDLACCFISRKEGRQHAAREEFSRLKTQFDRRVLSRKHLYIAE